MTGILPPVMRFCSRDELVRIINYADLYCHPAEIELEGIRTLVMMLGAIPLPNGAGLFRKFRDALTKRVSDGQVIMIYPEAHIWPYYTDVRDFSPLSFSYAYMNNKPVYCFTNIYKKRLIGSRPRVETWIDGPFRPDMSRKRKENVALLKEQVYGAMKKRIR